MLEQRPELHWLRGILWAVLLVSMLGMTFSGTLTYREVFLSAPACPSPGAAGTILGYPACVYGLAMYALLAVIAGWGLLHSKPSHRVSLPLTGGAQ
ncbi:MAG: hypothetical protein ABI625_07610 [bacterium]